MSISPVNKTVKYRASSENNLISAVFAGDCCPWETGIELIRNGRTAEIAATVKPFISSSDLKIIQFETPLTALDTPIDKSGPNLKCPPECVELLNDIGFNVALLANNHIGDHGEAATLETIACLNNAGIKCVGAGKTPDAAGKPLLLDAHNITVALLNFAENEFGTVKPDSAGCAPLSPLDNIRAIRKAKKEADLVFVAVHGGHERYPIPSPRMVNTYRAFVEAGASAVINCHIHCPAGIELWNDSPIIYSPGNFFFPWRDLTADHLNAMWWIGYLPKLHCDRHGVYALEIMPYRFDNERLYSLTPSAEKEFFHYLSMLSRLLDDQEARQRYFEAWSAHGGSFYLSWIRDQTAKWPINLDSREAVRELLPFRNMFTCESHHDLMAQYLRLMEEGRISQALESWPEIENMQRPSWIQQML